MKGQSSYAPPAYIPLGMSDTESAIVLHSEDPLRQQSSVDGPKQWSSGICACCDDMQSCCVGLFCPCFLFGKNAEFLGSGTLLGSCMTHFILWALVNTVCCLLTEGLFLGIPGCFVACYACGYRSALRTKYNLQWLCFNPQPTQLSIMKAHMLFVIAFASFGWLTPERLGASKFEVMTAGSLVDVVATGFTSLYRSGYNLHCLCLLLSYLFVILRGFPSVMFPSST